MTAELLTAIALLCQVHAGPYYNYSDVFAKQLQCQQNYIDCVKTKTLLADLAPKALANCIKERK